MGFFEKLSPFPAAKSIEPPDQFENGPAGVVGVGDARHMRISQTEAAKHLEVYGGRYAVDWVMDCVDVYATTYADAPYHFENDEGERFEARDKSKRDADDFKSAPFDLRGLLDQPNPQTDGNQFRQQLMIDYLMVGNSYWLKFGNPERPKALYRLDPRYIQIRPGARRDVVEYVYVKPGSTERRFKVNEVIHVKRPNPHSPYFGIGVIAGGARVIDIELAMSASMNAYYENGTRLSGVLETDRTLQPAMFNKIRRSFSAMYQGVSAGYQVAVLERGLKFKPIQSTAADAEFSKLSPQIRSRIAAMFKLPLSMLGDVGQGDSNSVNKESRRTWSNDIMKPLIGRIDSQLTSQLTAYYGLRLITDYAYEMPIEDQYDLGAVFSATPGVTVREVRERMGLPPLGNDIDDMVLNLPGEEENESEVKDRNLGPEGGRPPKGENTASFPKSGKLPKDAKVRVGA